MHNLHNASVELNYSDITGVLLAGGQSRRMGRDKALIEIEGETLFSRALALLQRYFSRVLIAGNRADLERPGVPAIADTYPGSALGGLHTGLSAANTDWIFVIPCDMPYPDGRLIELLLQQRDGVDAVVPLTPGGYEPVFALYHRNCLSHIENMLKRNQCRIYDFYRRINVHFVDWHQLPAGWERSLLNINTPEQLSCIQRGAKIIPPIVSIVAKSGTGKTTFLEKIISELKKRSYRAGVIKHDTHRFEIDHEGKDSWRLTRAGADTMMITSLDKVAMVKLNRDQKEPLFTEAVAAYCSDLDIVLTEGFKRSNMPEIEVHRLQRSECLLCRHEQYDPHLIAVASDSKL